MKLQILVLFCSALLANACSTTSHEGAQQPVLAAMTASGVQERPGFVAIESDGRLTVFQHDSKELASFRKDGELGKSVTRIGAGPNGMTLRAPDLETIEGYTAARPGFATRVVEGRIWVFVAGSKDWEEFLTTGEPAKSVTRIGAGPNGMTVKAPDAAVIEAWLAAQ
jgi:hypothetical protein